MPAQAGGDFCLAEPLFQDTSVRTRRRHGFLLSRRPAKIPNFT